ncbi:hypothetical protein [Brevibacillus sp. NRS-1366]|uniref:hypothetical protein n=1 Tax=Brevibacillus sp. NRS-1366 TaxID=3233899 RepID=UPI003D20BF91
MLEQLWFFIQMYLLTLIMTPFGLVMIPRGIGLLEEHLIFALIYYSYLLFNPLLFRMYLCRIKRRADLQKQVWNKRKQWIRGVMWTILSHLVVFEMVYLFVMQSKHTGAVTNHMAAVALSSLALFILAASTWFLSYKHAPAQKETSTSPCPPYSR